jgi:hypothetical protein
MDISWKSALHPDSQTGDRNSERDNHGSGLTLKKRMIDALASCRKGVDHSHQMMSSSTWAGLVMSFLSLWIREGRGTYEEQTSYHA